MARGFWRRPFAVRNCSWRSRGRRLYWWEVDRQGLIHHQFEAIAGRTLQVGAFAAHLDHAGDVCFARRLADVDGGRESDRL